MSFSGDFTTVEFDLSTLTVLIKMAPLNAVIHRIFCGMNFFCKLKHQQMLNNFEAMIAFIWPFKRVSSLHSILNSSLPEICMK